MVFCSKQDQSGDILLLLQGKNWLKTNKIFVESMKKLTFAHLNIDY